MLYVLWSFLRSKSVQGSISPSIFSSSSTSLAWSSKSSSSMSISRSDSASSEDKLSDSKDSLEYPLLDLDLKIQNRKSGFQNYLKQLESIPHKLQIWGLLDGWQGGPQFVSGSQVSQCPRWQFPDQPLTMSYSAFTVVFVQLVYHNAKTVYKAAGWNLKQINAIIITVHG